MSTILKFVVLNGALETTQLLYLLAIRSLLPQHKEKQKEKKMDTRLTEAIHDLFVQGSFGRKKGYIVFFNVYFI